MIYGFDVSRYQSPDKLDWDGMADAGMFLIARATYGARYADPLFAEFAKRAGERGIPFGAYHFFLEAHPVADQLAAFERQLLANGDLKYGDFLPCLDLEGKVSSPKAFAWGGEQMADAWRAKFGGAILYQSAYFPSHLGPKENWAWMLEDGFRHWIAQYGVGVGKCSLRYLPAWHAHQYAGDDGRSHLYGGGNLPIDLDAAPTLDGLLIDRSEPRDVDVHREVASEEPNIPWVTGLDDETRAGLEEARKADNENLSEEQS